jgi:hypothetical protein
MGNDPRIGLAVGMLTAWLHGDAEGFNSITSDFEGGCPEALASLARVTQAIVRMFGDTAGKTPEETMEIIAAAIALGDDGDGSHDGS